MLDVKKIDRGSNQVAHGLAQIGKRESSGVLNDSAPPFVAALIANDCKHLALQSIKLTVSLKKKIASSKSKSSRIVTC
jgi:hypothetical protein